MILPPNPRPFGVNTSKEPTSVRVSRTTLDTLHEIKRRTGLGIDAIIYALAAEVLHAGSSPEVRNS